MPSDDYLLKCAAAIDALLERLNRLLHHRSIVPPQTTRTSPLFAVQPDFRALPHHPSTTAPPCATD